MSKKERPLPRPPRAPFGSEKRFEGGEQEDALMADRMAAAMAEGRLEEFMKEEMPDNDYAKALAGMMMGMTGMLSPGGFAPLARESDKNPENVEEVKASEEMPSGVQLPDDIIQAVHSGDVAGMMGILAREHKKRMPESETIPPEERKADETPGLSKVEKQTLDRIVQIASENNVSVDWIVLRSLRLYIKEYQKTGRL